MKLSTNLFKPLSALLNGFFVAFSYNLIILAVILNYYINYLNIFIMDSTSLTVITLWILGSFVFLAFIYLVWAFVYFRGMAEKAREKGCAFEKDVNIGKTVLYYCYDSHFFMNNKGEKVSDFFGDNSFEILVATFSSDSMIPEKAYRVYVAQTDLADEDDDKGKPIIQVCFSPMKNDISKWTVAKVEIRDLVLEHPLMGKLCVPKRFKEDAQVGETITLISEVTKIGNNYRLEYKPVG